MTKAIRTTQVTKAIRRAGYAAECVNGNGYIYFVADDMREIDSVYVCYLSHLPVETYVEHVSKFFQE